jgi:hypothetical protein
MTGFQKYTPESLFLGCFEDLPSLRVPLGGFAHQDGWRIKNDKLESLPGWTQYKNLSSTSPFIFGYDWERHNKIRHLILATGSKVFELNRSTFSLVELGTGFATVAGYRWQKAAINNLLFLVNGADPIQQYNGSALTPLAGDATLPDSSTHMTSLAGHLVLGAPIINGTIEYSKVMWSDFDYLGNFTPSSTSSAGSFTLPKAITGIEAIDDYTLFVYAKDSIFRFSYLEASPWFAIDTIHDAEGLNFPYSLVKDTEGHFFIGQNNIYFASRSSFKDLGTNKVTNFLFQELDSTAHLNVYGWAHPNGEEIWWVYIPRTGSDWTSAKAIIYNKVYNAFYTWSTFPHSMLVEFLEQNVRTIGEITTPFQSATLTWREKHGKGVWLILSGD